MLRHHLKFGCICSLDGRTTLTSFKHNDLGRTKGFTVRGGKPVQYRMRKMLQFGSWGWRWIWKCLRCQGRDEGTSPHCLLGAARHQECTVSAVVRYSSIAQGFGHWWTQIPNSSPGREGGMRWGHRFTRAMYNLRHLGSENKTKKLHGTDSEFTTGVF